MANMFDPPPTDKSQGNGIPPAKDFADIKKRQSARIMYENRIIFSQDRRLTHKVQNMLKNK
jgi:hypothetical protein